MSYENTNKVSHAIRCPQCRANSNVTDSRPIRGMNGTRRRRVCPRCDFRFNTFEYIDDIGGSKLKRYLKTALVVRKALQSLDILLEVKEDIQAIEYEDRQTDLDIWRGLGDNNS